MKLFLSTLGFILLPTPFLVLAWVTGSLYWTGWEEIVYILGPAFGLSAFVWFNAQFLLASRPFKLDKLLGVKTLLTLHGLGGLLGFAAAFGHWYVKFVVQQNPPSLQSLPGFVALNLFTLAILVAVVLMANQFPAPAKVFKGLREWVKAHWGWTYKGLRGFHNVTVIAGILVIFHVFMAYSVQSSPWLAAALGVWTLGSLGLYGVYRLRGRKSGTSA